MTEQPKSSKSRPSPPGVPQYPVRYNVVEDKNRLEFIDHHLKKSATSRGRDKIRENLVRRKRRSPHWMNEPNAFGLDASVEFVLAVLDNLDIRTLDVIVSLDILAENTGMEKSRMSRTVERNALAGLLITEKAAFNPADKKCFVKRMQVTPVFFAVLNIPMKKVYRARAHQMGEMPETVIEPTDARLIPVRVEIWRSMNAAGTRRVEKRRAKQLQAKKEHYSTDPPSLF